MQQLMQLYPRSREDLTQVVHLNPHHLLAKIDFEIFFGSKVFLGLFHLDIQQLPWQCRKYLENIICEEVLGHFLRDMIFGEPLWVVI